MGSRRQLTVVIATAVIVVGCSSSTEPRCAATAETAVNGFIEALESGDAALADGFFSDTDFGWFSETPGRLDLEARLRDTLFDYLTVRIADGARFELASFDFTGRTAGSDMGNFGFVLRNEAGSRLNSKGAVNCETGKIIVLSLGLPT